MEMKNHYVAFAARFAGVSRDIYLPIMSITAIYSEENRKGMVFADEVYDHTHENELKANSINDSIDSKTSSHKSHKVEKIKSNKNRPTLKIVASNPDLDNKDNK
jgi:stringent starvation protein B